MFSLWLALICVVAGPAWGGAPRDPSIAVQDLENGVRVVVRQVPDADRVALRAVVHVGWRDDPPGKEGMAHLLEHVAFEGTERFPAAKLKEVLAESGTGADSNAQLGERTTTYQLSVLPEDLAVGVAALADIVRAPQFGTKEVAKSRAALLDELGRSGSPDRALRSAGDLLSITKLDATSLQGFHQQWVRPDRVDIIVTGPVGADAVAVVGTELGSWRVGGHGPDRKRGKGERPEFEYRQQPLGWVVLELPPSATSAREKAARQVAVRVLDAALDDWGAEAAGDDPVVVFAQGGDADKVLSHLLTGLAEVPTDGWAAARDEVAARAPRDLDAFEWAALLARRCQLDEDPRGDVQAERVAIAAAAAGIGRDDVERDLREMLGAKRLRLLVAGPTKVNGAGFLHRARAALDGARVVDRETRVPRRLAVAAAPETPKSKPGNAAPEPAPKAATRRVITVEPAKPPPVPEPKVEAPKPAVAKAPAAPVVAALEAKVEAPKPAPVVAKEAAKAAAPPVVLAPEPKVEAPKPTPMVAKEPAQAPAAPVLIAPEAMVEAAKLVSVASAKEPPKPPAASVPAVPEPKIEAPKPAPVVATEATEAPAPPGVVAPEAKEAPKPTPVVAKEPAKAPAPPVVIAPEPKVEAPKASPVVTKEATKAAAPALVAPELKVEAPKPVPVASAKEPAKATAGPVPPAAEPRVETSKPGGKIVLVAQVSAEALPPTAAVEAAPVNAHSAPPPIKVYASKRAEAASVARPVVTTGVDDDLEPSVTSRVRPVEAPKPAAATRGAGWWATLKLPIGDARIGRWDDTSVEIKYKDADWEAGREGWIRTLVAAGWRVDASTVENGRATDVLVEGTRRLTLRFGLPPGSFGYVTQVSLARM